MYLKHATSPAHQTEKARADQIQNNAGGFVFGLSCWQRLARFLVLGSEGGTYYASERKLTRENAAVVEQCIKEDGIRLVDEVVAISDAGRAPKNDPAILALAMAARLGNDGVRMYALAALPKVCRIGTHLYHFASFANDLGGWGRGLRRAVAEWFNAKKPDDLAHQLVKYQSRDGWSSRDLLRLSHAKARTPEHDSLYAWATRGIDDPRTVEKLNALPPLILAFEEAKVAELPKLLQLIEKYKLPREAVPTAMLNKPQVWEALLPHMGATAMIRNLATMTRAGVIAPLASANATIIEKITSTEELKRGRVHPIQLLSASMTYAKGAGDRGTNTWTPVQQIVDALDDGFYAAFGAVEPTGKATVLAIDCSASMTWNEIAGIRGLTPRTASAAMALVTANVEKNHHFLGFTSKMVDMPISPRMRLSQVVDVIERTPAGATNCSLPFLWAKSGRHKVESFAVYTDNETYAGNVHPNVALQDYRNFSGLNSRSVVVGMTATQFTIADPTDPGMLDVVGFDASAPAVMSEFFGGSGTK